MSSTREKQWAYLQTVKGQRNNIFESERLRNKNVLWNSSSLHDVTKVVCILSSSRSGSSLLFSTLRNIPGIYSLSGESSPFFKLQEKFSLTDFLSDEWPSSINQIECLSSLSRDFLSDFSFEGNKEDILKDEEVFQEYLEALLLRLPMQWPQIPFIETRLESMIRKVFGKYKKTKAVFSTEEFFLEVLFALRREWNLVNPYYYDLPLERIRNRFHGCPIPEGPPCPVLSIEEPPFITISPRKKLKGSDLKEKILLLKTPADSYRTGFIESLFPNATFTFIYLTRNPLSSINGLYDGWLHRGFFSHNLEPFFTEKCGEDRELHITGYSDRFPWGKWWWKYDLPPHWQEYRKRSLEEVCAFQWKSAHLAIQKHLQDKPRCLTLAYEDFIKSSESKKQFLGKIISFLDLDPSCLHHMKLDNLPYIQITEAPRAYRWKQREHILLPLLHDKEIQSLGAPLGYTLDTIEQWI